jgi:hypothetical protein
MYLLTVDKKDCFQNILACSSLTEQSIIIASKYFNISENEGRSAGTLLYKGILI